VEHILILKCVTSIEGKEMYICIKIWHLLGDMMKRLITVNYYLLGFDAT
jgi:hypothetical protein